MAVMTGKKPFAVSLRDDYPPIIDFWLFPGGLKDSAFQLSSAFLDLIFPSARHTTPARLSPRARRFSLLTYRDVRYFLPCSTLDITRPGTTPIGILPP
jgi:hypothetical protein